MQAKAVFFVAPRSVEIRTVDVPADAGEMVVRTLYSGISSGTEILAYRGLIDPSLALDERLDSLGGRFEFPFSYGYSCVGVVENPVADLSEGSLVFAFHPHQDLFRCRAGDAIPLSGIRPRIGTLFPSVETALQISLDAGRVDGEQVLVFGLGTVGLLTAALLRRAGASVIGIDPKPWRAAAAEAVGIEVVPPGGIGDEVGDRTGGEGAALAIEASGNPDVLASALPLLHHEGTAIVASWYGTQPAVLPLGADFHRRRLTIRSSQVSTIPKHLAHEWNFDRRRATAVDLLRELPLEVLATHEWPFEEAAAAFASVDRGEEGLVHAALKYGDSD